VTTKKPFRRLIIKGGAVALLAALLFSAAGGVHRYFVYRCEHRRLSREVSSLKVDVENKKSLLVLAKDDPDLVEGEARRQLGLIGEGEIEFRFVPDQNGGPEHMESETNDESR
jgi:cell division protein FtsB